MNVTSAPKESTPSSLFCSTMSTGSSGRRAWAENMGWPCGTMLLLNLSGPAQGSSSVECG